MIFSKNYRFVIQIRSAQASRTINTHLTSWPSFTINELALDRERRIARQNISQWRLASPGFFADRLVPISIVTVYRAFLDAISHVYRDSRVSGVKESPCENPFSPPPRFPVIFSLSSLLRAMRAENCLRWFIFIRAPTSRDHTGIGDSATFIIKSRLLALSLHSEWLRDPPSLPSPFLCPLCVLPVHFVCTFAHL